MIWELYLCAGITWAGCAFQHVVAYPSEESCYRALKEMKTGDSPVAESEKKRSLVAYFRPKEMPQKQVKP